MTNDELSINTEPAASRKDNDGLHKRRGIWHYKLNVNGRWKEFSAHTRNYHEARNVRAEAIANLKRGRYDGDRGKQPFRKAAEEWFESRRGDKLAEKTRTTEKERLKPLVSAFGDKRVSTFTIDDIKAYRAERQSRVGPRTINLEIKVLRMILQRAKYWARLAEDYLPLRENSKGPGVTLSLEQERLLFEAAVRKPLWEAAYLAALLAVNTTMRSVELRGLRLADVDLFAKIVSVRRASSPCLSG